MPDSRVLVLPVVVLFTKLLIMRLNTTPLWIDRMNLRFVYRMYKEKHTRKRYVQAALLFPARFLWEKLIFSWYKDSKPL